MIIEDFYGNQISLDMDSEYEIHGVRYIIVEYYNEIKTKQMRVVVESVEGKNAIFMGIIRFKELATKVEE